MSYIVEPQFTRLKIRISPRTWDQIKAKAQWEGCSLSAVVKDWPSLLPKRLQRFVPMCFADTLDEMLTARIAGLRRELREAERQFARCKEKQK